MEKPRKIDRSWEEGLEFGCEDRRTLVPEPDEVRLACIGCGALNAAGAEVCTGCGHRFAGPGCGPISQPAPGSAPAFPVMHFRDDELYKPPRPNPDEMMLGCFAKVFGITVAVIATIAAFVVAFFVTCSATFQTDGVLIWSVMAGVAAAGLVVAFSVWIATRIGGR